MIQDMLHIKIIGKKVQKRSKKPFKSACIINTVKNVTINQDSGKIAFTFEEDDSIVDVYQCELVVL